MILNDEQVEIVRKHYLLNIFDRSAKRQNLNIKGRRETGIKGTGERILHRPYLSFQAVRNPPQLLKKKGKI